MAAAAVVGDERLGDDAVSWPDASTGRADGWRRQRYEIKYVVDHRLKAELEARLGHYMRPDPNVAADADGYVNHSIYFDSPRYRFYLEKHEGLRERIKPRLRAYRPGPGQPPRACFLELKGRRDRIVWKERVPVSRELAERLLRPGSLAFTGEIADQPVLAKFYYLVQRFALQPCVTVLYHRRALIGEPFANLRVTLDTRLQASWATSLESPPSAFRYALAPNRFVCEVKYDRLAPRVILDAVRALGLRQATFSKFAVALESAHAARRSTFRSYLDRGDVPAAGE